MPRLKVCGITDAAFAAEAARRGVDYLGLIFAAGSPRRVTPEQAREIVCGQDSCATVADAVLLDGRKGTQRGGTGMRADWSQVAALKLAGRRVILAGGISAANVAAAAATGADVLDANSALETSPGRKSVRLLDEFLASMPRRNMVK